MNVVNNFLKYIRYELNLSAHTVLSYNKDLGQFIDFLKSDCETLDVSTITLNDVRGWMVSLSKNGFTPRSIRRKVQSLRAFFKWCMKNNLIETNPAQDVELAKLPKRLPVYVRPEVMSSVLAEEFDSANFEESRDHLILSMFYETGIRRAELIGLQDVNVDTAKGEIKVFGKRSKERIVPIGAELCSEISDYRKLRDEIARYPEAFFIRPNGEPLYESLVYKVVRTHLEQTGCEKCSPHVLRHSFASAMLNNGAEINSVKELLGHQSLAATQVYTHITIQELKQNYQQAHPRAIKKGG